MAQRIGGTCFLKINGSQYPARGSWEYEPCTSERTFQAGQDSPHGYTEKPTVPGMKGDVTDFGGISIAILQQSDIDVATLELGNGKTVMGYDGAVEGKITSSSEDGKFNLEMRFIEVIEL